MINQTQPATMINSLSPTQEKSFAHILQAIPSMLVVGLTGPSGLGKTTILQKVRAETGGQWIAARELLHSLRQSHPLAIEETFVRIVESAFQATDIVFLDDLWLLSSVVAGCGAYPRSNLLASVYESITQFAESNNKKLIFASEFQQHDLEKKGYAAAIPYFGPEDYEFFSRVYLGEEQTSRIDFRKVYRFARYLGGYDLKNVVTLLRNEKALDSDVYIESLRSFGLTSNVNLGEVQQITLSDLKGIDDVVESLETNVVLPLEQLDLAEELGLKPKRGVLLAGPPGTGKTTVGRALAHRLKSKFFLIDGTYISGTNNFYGRVASIFEEAKHNAPAIIFVDDGDVIFEGGEDQGFYRYLLTMLDGLESESAGQVCVMMTAMDVGNLPPALIRSGRIELWLEMRLPDAAARTAILSGFLERLAPVIGVVDVTPLVEVTEGFTGADLKRLIEDGKNLLAADRARKVAPAPPTEYFLRAVETVRVNKERYAEAEERARQRRHPSEHRAATLVSTT
jgi:shikimate kinase